MTFHAITNNLQWKLLALLLAVILWSAVVGEPELVTSQSAPVYYKNLPRDLLIGSGAPDRIHLELRGPAGKLSPSSLDDTAVLVDLSPVRAPGERTFTIDAGSINLPTGVVFLRAVPSQLRLQFERLFAKDVPVQIRAGSQLPGEFAIQSQSVTPQRMRIIGPESRVRHIEHAQTDPIDFSSITGRAEFRVHAYVSDPQVRFEGSPIVTVAVQVEKKP
jgi:YbbR domain-containing protein